jgi:hypothetical protein
VTLARIDDTAATTPELPKNQQEDQWPPAGLGAPTRHRNELAFVRQFYLY